MAKTELAEQVQAHSIKAAVYPPAIVPPPVVAAKVSCSQGQGRVGYGSIPHCCVHMQKDPFLAASLEEQVCECMEPFRSAHRGLLQPRTCYYTDVSALPALEAANGLGGPSKPLTIRN